MKRDTQGAILLAVGSVMLTLSVTGGFQAYVRTGLRVPLIAAGLVLAALGASAIIVRPEGAAGDDGHGHGAVSLRIGFTLLALVMAAYLVAPAPLGAYAAARGDQNRVVFSDRTDVAALAPPAPAPPADDSDQPVSTPTTAAVAPATSDDAPPPVDRSPVTAGQPQERDVAAVPAPPGFVELTLYDLLTYTLFEPDWVRGRTVRLIGFAADEPEFEGAYRLTRFLMSCCAADAFPLQVIVTGAPPPPLDQWVEVDAVWSGEMIELDEYTSIPVVEVIEQREIDAPAQPYEY